MHTHTQSRRESRQDKKMLVSRRPTRGSKLQQSRKEAKDALLSCGRRGMAERVGREGRHADETEIMANNLEQNCWVSEQLINAEGESFLPMQPSRCNVLPTPFPLPFPSPHFPCLLLSLLSVYVSICSFVISALPTKR